MSATITLSDLSWSTPDGRSLFSGLNLSFGTEKTGLVGRNGVGKSTLLKLISGVSHPQSGTVFVDGSVAVLHQSVQVAPEQTIADVFGARAGLAILHRAGRGEASDEDLANADWTLDARMASSLGRFGLHVALDTQLSGLSGGQRTRVRLAALVFAEPDFILLDEPTNDLDRDGRRAVFELLASWPAGALVVSHDRSLLDTMDSIVELTTLGATRYGGNWSFYRARKAEELEAARHDLADAEKRLSDTRRRAQVTAERKARTDKTGRRARTKGDAPKMLLDKRKDRSERTDGSNARLNARRRDQAMSDHTAARARIEILQPFSMTLPPTGLPSGRTVLDIQNVTTGYDPPHAIIRTLSLTMTGPERVALTGPNGSGKTTLLALIRGTLKPWAGRCRVITDFALLDQTVSLMDPKLSIRDNYRRMHPEADENTCRAGLARFLFRADAALQPVSQLSGGQVLRAGLACVLGGSTAPPLLILDEPTNHLDIESLDMVEAGLRAYDGALLVVSHDETFLSAIDVSRRLELPAKALPVVAHDHPL